MDNVKSKKGVILEAQRDKKKVHFATLMDICHLKSAELEPKLQKYRGRVVIREDTVKDDSEAYAVFTEQGSSASRMTATKIMDVVSRLPGCDGQAADAVSAYTQVELEDAPRLLKTPNRKVQTFGYVFHDMNGSNHVETLKIPWYFLNETWTVILQPYWYGKDNSNWIEESTELGMCFRSSNTWVIFVSICG